MKLVSSDVVDQLHDMAHRLRLHSIVATNASKSGHPTSCASIAEIMSCLFFHVMRTNVSEPKSIANDRLVLSKGHAAPILYAAWAELGLFPVDELLSLRKFDSDLEGHPTPRLAFVDVATGSLGQGLSNACGMAYVAKYFDRIAARVYCIIGDGESAEGSIWEAVSFASAYRLDNLCVIVDVNRLGQSQETLLKHDLDAYASRFVAFGAHVITVDGHDVAALLKAFAQAKATTGTLTVIVAKTLKGKDFPGVEDDVRFHGQPMGDRFGEIERHLRTKMRTDGRDLVVRPEHPELLPAHVRMLQWDQVKLSSPPAYRRDDDVVATRFAYGTALAKLAQNCPQVIALDADTKNSTFSQTMLKVDSTRFLECYIAEQNMVGVAIGAACRERAIAFVSTFGAFLTRAVDQIRMAAISRSNINIVGSHCGVSIGEDGPSQMALEDLAIFRSIPGCVVFYPSDAVSCERAVELAARVTDRMCYIRTTRPATKVIYANDEPFAIGVAKLVVCATGQGETAAEDRVLIATAGVTTLEAIRAAQELKDSKGIHVRVLDLFTIKPIDTKAILEHGAACGHRILTVEDHYAEGGIGDAVKAAVAHIPVFVVHSIAVNSVPRSGTPARLMDYYGLTATKIASKVESMLAV